jgi:hypothetical protein
LAVLLLACLGLIFLLYEYPGRKPVKIQEIESSIERKLAMIE